MVNTTAKINTISNCKKCNHKLCTQKVSIFSSLNMEQLAKVGDLINHRRYKKGELLVMEGEKTESLVIINEGQVKAYKTTLDGKEQIIYIFSEGDFFGSGIF